MCPCHLSFVPFSNCGVLKLGLERGAGVGAMLDTSVFSTNPPLVWWQPFQIFSSKATNEKPEMLMVSSQLIRNILTPPSTLIVVDTNKSRITPCRSCPFYPAGCTTTYRGRGCNLRCHINQPLLSNLFCKVYGNRTNLYNDTIRFRTPQRKLDVCSSSSSIRFWPHHAWCHGLRCLELAQFRLHFSTKA
jgi:hypothetical protein